MAYLVATDKTTYTLYLNSVNKTAGSTNNIASFNVNWDTFLPRQFVNYKIIFNFQTVGGYYKDVVGKTYTSGKIYMDLGSRSYTYDTATNGGSQILGIITRDIQTTTSSSNTFSAFFYQNASKTIGRPTQNLFNVRIYNNFDSSLLTNTDNVGVATADMTDWNMMIEFIPIDPNNSV
jgi:hypothetical protein